MVGKTNNVKDTPNQNIDIAANLPFFFQSQLFVSEPNDINMGNPDILFMVYLLLQKGVGFIGFRGLLEERSV